MTLELFDEVRQGHLQRTAYLLELDEVEPPLPRLVLADEGLGTPKSLSQIDLTQPRLLSEPTEKGGKPTLVWGVDRLGHRPEANGTPAAYPKMGYSSTVRSATTGERFNEALAATLRARGLEPNDLVAALAVRDAQVVDWILGDSEPPPRITFRIEELLDVHPGSLSRLLGYLPLGPVASGLAVEDVVRNSPLVDDDLKCLVLAVWRELVKRSRGAGPPALRAVPADPELPRARRRPGIALIEHKRDFQCELRDRGRAESTIRNASAALEQFYRFLCRTGHPGTDVAVRQEDVERFLEEIAVKRPPSTVAARRRALQVFFQWLVDEGDIRESPILRTRSTP